MKIIFGTGITAREYISLNGIDDVFCFIDNTPKDDFFCGKPVFSFKKLLEIYKDKEVLVAVKDLFNAYDIVSLLNNYKIPYTWMYEKGFSDALIHVYGIYPNIKFEVNSEEPTVKWRSDFTIKMLKNILYDESYLTLFSGKNFNFWFYVQDDVYKAYMHGYIRKLSNIFAYSTYEVFKDYVIPFPDYNSNIDDSIARFSFNDLYNLAKEPYKYNCLFWGGNIKNHISRICTYLLKEENKKYLHIRSIPPGGIDKPLSIQEQSEYKYLLDIQGYGWTDRLKYLLQLGRVVFITDRIFKEWYFDELIPMEHFVPIKIDLSDLIEKIQWLENNPDIYNRIASNMRVLANKLFHPSNVRIHMRDTLLKYGIEN